MQDSFQIYHKTLLIIGGIMLLIVLLLLFFAILYRKSNNIFLQEKALMKSQYQLTMVKTQLETQEATLELLGKELHDNVGQLLNSTKMLIGVATRGMPQVPETLLLAEDTLSKAINEIRTLSKTLSSEWLAQFDFAVNLQTEAERITAAKQHAVHFVCPTALPLGNDEQVVLFRIVQEALQNAIKHAQATQINILAVVDAASKEIQITIADNGIGFHTQDIPLQGIGITNIKHRVGLLKGKVVWTSHEGKGTTIAISIPIIETENEVEQPYETAV